MKPLNLFLLAALFVVLGCEDRTTLMVLTDAPPSRFAEVIDDDDEEFGGQRMKISSGVAVAIECFFVRAEDSSYYAVGDPCPNLEITVEPAGLLQVEPAHLDGSPWISPYAAQQVPTQGDAQGRDRAVRVLIGREAGTGTLTARHAEDEVTFELEVVAHPAAEE